MAGARLRLLTGSALVRHIAAPGVAWRVGYQAVDTRREHADGPLGGSPFESAARSSFHDGRTDTLQARLDAALGASNVIAAGYELERERYRDASTSHPGAIAIDGRSHALYAQNRLSLLDGRVQITLGGGRVQAFDLSDPVFAPASGPAAGAVAVRGGGAAPGLRRPGPGRPRRPPRPPGRAGRAPRRVRQGREPLRPPLHRERLPHPRPLGRGRAAGPLLRGRRLGS